ncbi:MAG: HEAT repeat domain-containing protein [Planctomycetota bacterium]|nr:HEAT repeat domain-containing protein [Planctomycetota bacterium]
MRTGLAAAILTLGLLCHCTPAQAQQSEDLSNLETALKDSKNTHRNAPQVLRWRRDANFILRLTELTLNGKAPLNLRENAVRLLGACGEREQTAKTLFVLAQQSQFPKRLQTAASLAGQRIRQRRKARAYLKLGQLQRLLPKNTLNEIQILAQDPFESRNTPALREQALRVLERQRPFVSAIFIALINNENDAPPARRQALAALFVNAPKDIEKIIPTLLNTSETSLYNTSLEKIGQIPPRAIQLVHRQLGKSGSLQERLRACEILGSARWLPSIRDFNKIRQNASEAITIRLEALRALISLGKINKSKAAGEILNAMRLIPDKQRWRAIRALKTLPVSVVKVAVLPLFTNPTQDERLRAIQLTNSLNLTELAPSLRRIAKNGEEQEITRILAITTLGRQRLPQNAKTLLGILRSDSSPWVRSHAARALRHPLFKSPAIRETLEKLLGSNDSNLKHIVIESLVVHGDVNSSEKLSQILVSPKVRTETGLVILRALQKLPPPKSSLFLLKIETDDVDTAQELVTLLAHYENRSSVDIALSLLDHRDPSIRSQAWRLLLNWFPAKTMKLPEGAIPFRYNPNDPPTTRRRAALRWRAWWTKNKDVIVMKKKNS